MSKSIELKENLLENNGKLSEMADDVMTKLEEIDRLIEKLQDYCSRIGTPRDSEIFHKELKDNIFSVSVELREATKIVNRVDNNKVNPDLEKQKRKQMRRVREAFKKKLDETIDLIKKIEKLEKRYVQDAKIFIQNKELKESFENSESGSKQWMQMSIDEEILRDREDYIIELHKLLGEMHATTKLQAKYLLELGEDLESVYNNVPETMDPNKVVDWGHEKENNYKLQLDTKCLIKATLVCVVFVVLFLFSSSPES